MTHLRTYLRVWWLVAANALQEAFINRWTNALFLLGKTIRFIMSLLLLWLLKEREISIGDYTSDQVIVFFLVYQLLDTITQVFFRGVYIFSNLIRNGEFDFLLSKPLSPLFRALTGKPDINDALFFPPTLLITAWIIAQLNVTVTWASLGIFVILFGNALLIATALHIIVMCLGIITTEVDHTIWIYRDILRLGQFPVTMYIEPIRLALFFMVPVGMMITVPSQVLLNLPATYHPLLVTGVGVGFFIFSLKLWQWSLRKYSSASS